MPDLISGPRKQAPSPAPSMGGVGNIFEGESDALMRIGGEIRRSGNVLAGAFERRRYIQGVDEYQQAQMVLEQKMAKSAENRMLDQNFDTQPKRFRAEMDQWYQGYEFKSNSARKRFRNYYGMNTAREELNIFKAATGKKLQRIDDSQTAMQDINTHNYLNITGESPEADQARSDILAEYGKSLDGHVMAGTMSQARVDQHKRAWAILLAQKVIKRQPELAAEMLAEGGDMDVIVPPELREFITPEDIDRLRIDASREVSFRQAGAIQQNEIETEKTQNDFFNKFWEKKLTWDQVRDSNREVTGEGGKDWWSKKIEAQNEDIIKGTDIVTDERVKSELEDKALYVSSGGVKIEALRIAALKARYEDKKISDTDFDEVMSIASREHQTYQSNAIGTVISEAGRTLLDTEEEEDRKLMAAMAAGADTEETMKEMKAVKRIANENYSQYKKNIHDWFAKQIEEGKNPDYTDIWTYGKMQLKFYTGRGGEELREYFKVKPAAAGAFEGEKGKSPEPGGMPQPKTKEQYEALPSGTVYIHPTLGRMVKK